MKEKPQWRHTCKDAVFLGRYEGDDLYYQQGQVAARFGGLPQDFLMAGSVLASGVAVLREAMRRCQERNLALGNGAIPVVMGLTTLELIAHALDEGRKITVFRIVNGRRKKHTVQANRDGTISESGTKNGGWYTTTRDFIREYPNSLGDIWLIEQGGGKLEGLEDDD